MRLKFKIAVLIGALVLGIGAAFQSQAANQPEVAAKGRSSLIIL
ncbi:hypothetical protein [Copranaerobaculum intestinale]|nr:hypothetical protein [Copranaerobaculum intestinale]